LAPKASVLADVPAQSLRAFAEATLNHRITQLQWIDHPTSPSPSPPTNPGAPNPPPPSAKNLIPGRPELVRSPLPTAQPAAVLSAAAAPGPQVQTAAATLPASIAAQRAIALSMVTFAKGAMDTFTQAIKISPIGMLHLERIEMEPAGIERGELVATIPLAPSETTNVTQKEWSVTNEEFSSIVTDYLENFSEKGVTEKSELADSTENESKHSQQLGLSASLSGSYGFVSFATSASANLSDATDTSSKKSRTDSKEVTSKASSRSKKERKVTIQTSSTVGKEETSTRTLTNPSATSTMRIDYFSMMRKWRVRLLQYGLRLTYDIAIPEPAATLRKLHADLANYNKWLSGSFQFYLDPSSITPANYQNLATSAGVAVEPPPDPEWVLTRTKTLTDSTGTGQGDTLEFDVKEGYEIERVDVGGYGRANDNSSTAYIHFPGDLLSIGNTATNDERQGSDFQNGSLPSLVGQKGHIEVPFFHGYCKWGDVFARVRAKPSEATMQAWCQRVWQTLHDAARDAYYAQVQAWTQSRDALKAQIEDVDTLTLRREEREEMMKGVLRWLLGPDFDFMPPDVVQLFSGPVGESFTGSELGLSESGWTTMFIYQEMVKFIQQAIEWENLLYFVYPYFWDVPTAWDFARTLEHPDPTRQAFLRAGSARVVLTIRSGYEDAFTSFVERGELGQILPPDHPYLTIGQEIQAYDQTNYPGIPPANPDAEPRPLLTPLQKKAWQDIQGIVSLLESYKTKNGAYPTTAQGLAALAAFGESQNPPATVPTADPWGNAYQYKSPGHYDDYELASLGADGDPGGEGDNADITSWADSSLIAEWFEYTPSHGLDISVTTALTDMQ
jgi:type II secretion system protein G